MSGIIRKMIVNIVLFSDFETLDVFGPVEVFGKVETFTLEYYSQEGGVITNTDGVKIETLKIENQTSCDILFIPGGWGVRREIDNVEFIDQIKRLAETSQYVLTVCTGSVLLTRTGLLDGKNATSNKRSFDWVKSNAEEVHWVRQARWVVDDKYYTSSGISAGIDMALGFISDLQGKEKAEEIASRIEYNWQSDKQLDNFWKQ